MRALLLDLDNTLIDRDAALARWLEQLLPRDERKAEHLEMLVACDQGGYGNKPAFFAALARLAGLSLAAVREAFVHDFPRHVQLKPDAQALLARFRGPTAILTNGHGRVQRNKLSAAGLEGRVDHVLVSEEVGVRKPDPAIFERALALVGCAAHEAMMVGDHPVLDVGGAVRAGLRGVLLRTRWFDPPADMTVVSALSELPW